MNNKIILITGCTDVPGKTITQYQSDKGHIVIITSPTQTNLIRVAS